jgi:hypothetical protein
LCLGRGQEPVGEEAPEQIVERQVHQAAGIGVGRQRVDPVDADQRPDDRGV